jgi:hypothetical protein
MSTLFHRSYHGFIRNTRWFNGTNVVKFEPEPGMVYIDDVSGIFSTKDISPCFEPIDVSAFFTTEDVAPCLELIDYADNFVLKNIIPQELYGSDPNY